MLRLSISIRLFSNLFPRTLSRQSLLYSTLIARLQVEGVTLHLLDDVLGLNFALESTKSILHRFAFLQSNFCHAHHPPNEDGFSVTRTFVFFKGALPHIGIHRKFISPESGSHSRM